MATVEASSSQFQDRLRDYQQAVGRLISGPAVWLLLLGLAIWALFAETDAFAVGVVSGSILALGALGLTLIYGVLKFAHFAHGDSMMFAAYVAFFALTGKVVGERPDIDVELPWSIDSLPGATTGIGEFSFGYGLLLAMLVAVAVMAVLFVGLDRLIYRPLRRRQSGIVIFAIASLGVALAIRALMLMLWGGTSRFYVGGLRDTTKLPFDVIVVTDQFFILGAALTLTLLVYLLLFRTKLGKAMRAMADNPDLALASGIDTQQIVNWTWVIGGSSVAVAGVLLALQAQLKPELGFVLLLPLFAATILGGIGSPQGALVGGMVVGIVQEVAVTFDVISAGYRFSIAFVILILALLIRPGGLFGAKS